MIVQIKKIFYDIVIFKAFVKRMTGFAFIFNESEDFLDLLQTGLSISEHR